MLKLTHTGISNIVIILMIKPSTNRSHDWRKIIRLETLEEVQARLAAHLHLSHWHEIIYLGDSLLLISLRAERKDIFEYLLTLPAACLALEREGGNLLRVAVEKSREWIVFLLNLADEHKVSIINQVDNCGVSVLYWVKDTDTLHLLLDKKADTNIKQNQVKSIAGIYAHRGHADLLQILMDRKVTVDEHVLVEAGQGRLEGFEGDAWQERPANHLQIFRSLRHLSPQTWKRALAYEKLFREYMVQYRTEYIRLHPNLHINDEVLELVQEVQDYFSSLPSSGVQEEGEEVEEVEEVSGYYQVEGFEI